MGPPYAALPKGHGALAEWGKRDGTPLPWADGFLAATALSQSLVLVTGNTKDYAPFGACQQLLAPGQP